MIAFITLESLLLVSAGTRKKRDVYIEELQCNVLHK